MSTRLFCREATSDINVQCIFNNAGFIVTGFYDSSLEGKQMANLECNATASAKVGWLSAAVGNAAMIVAALLRCHGCVEDVTVAVAVVVYSWSHA